MYKQKNTRPIFGCRLIFTYSILFQRKNVGDKILTYGPNTWQNLKIAIGDKNILTELFCLRKRDMPRTNRKITECATRDTFKTLRILHLMLWFFCELVGLNIIYMDDIVLYNKVLINLVLVLCSIGYSIYNSRSSTDKLY